MFLVVLLYVLMASAFTLGKAVIAYIQPIFFIGVRMTVAGSLLLGYLYFFNRSRWRLNREDWGLYLQIILFHIFIPYVGEFWSLQYVTAAKASLLFNLAPFITAFFAFVLLSERLSMRQWLGLFIGCLGSIPILLHQTKGELITAHVGFLSTPEIALLLAVAASAYAWIVMKHLIIERDYSPVMINGIGMLGGGIMALILSIPMEGTPLIVTTQRALGLSSFGHDMLMLVTYTAALIIIANIICYNLYGYLLRHHSATFLAFAGFMTPLFTALFDWLLFGDVITMSFLFSVGIIVAGLYLFYEK